MAEYLLWTGAVQVAASAANTRRNFLRGRGQQPKTVISELVDGEIRCVQPRGAEATAQEMQAYYQTGEMPSQFEAIQDPVLRKKVLDMLEEVYRVTTSQADSSRRLILPRRGRGKVNFVRGDLDFDSILARCQVMRAAHEANGLDTCWAGAELEGYAVAVMEDDIELPNLGGEEGGDQYQTRYRIDYGSLSSGGTVTQWRAPGVKVPVWRLETPWPAGVVEEVPR